MRVPLGWLAEWIDLPEQDALCDKLTFGGLEVDAVERTGPDLADFVVGRVAACERHPEADRLSVCEVEVGGEGTSTIVCGAPNVAAGQRVAVAVPGTRLTDGTKIKKSKLRGVTSHGMICSTRELGLGDEHDGILVLDTDAEPGTPLDRVVPAGETVLDIAITANRGDCASMLGIAREVRAHFGGTLRLPEIAPEEAGAPSADAIRVEIEDRAGCHRYDARVVRGVKLGPSPAWLQERLEAAGLRPINVVVDVTNLVMWEFGQPIHAFDLARVAGGVIRVRSAAEGETIETLDGEKRRLEPDDLVIADAERAVAIAGVMGGANSEVADDTTDVLIESAHFAPTRVRRTARRLGISTDASYRFERAVDREGVGRAADRAARLLAELAGGEVAAGAVSARGEPAPAVERVELDPARVERLLGVHIPTDQVREALARVGIESEPTDAGLLVCRIPSHRNDIALREDLIEEVARVHGYDQIEPTTPHGPLVEGRVPATWPLESEVRDALQGEGLVELMTFPFLDADDLDRLGLTDDDPRRGTLRVLNPISEQEARLRTHLAPTLLRRVRENRNRQVDRVALFELARTYLRGAEGELPEERLQLCALLVRGEERRLWDPRDPEPIFFAMKGAAERLLRRLARGARLVAGSPEPYLHPGASCSITVGKQVVGSVGELHPEVAARFDLDAPLALLELDLDALAACPVEVPRYQEVSRHPRVKRDLAVVIDRDQAAGEVLEAIRKQAGANLHSVEVFDRYEGKGVPDGKLSLAFRLVFQRIDRTLTDAEVGKAVDRVVQMLAHRFGGALR